MAVRGRRRAAGKPTETRMEMQFWQLCAALLILAAVLTARFFAPEQTRAFLRQYFTSDESYTELLETVGESLRAFFPGGAVPADASGDNAAPDVPASPAADGGAVNETTTQTPPAAKLGVGGFGEPLPMFFDSVPQIEERFLVPPAVDGEDDTLPLPFGFEKPERADFTVYELPFRLSSPVSGYVSSAYGYRLHPIRGEWSFHYGVDVAGENGDPVKAAADGNVAACGLSDSYGKYILIDHGEGYATFYAHLSRISVKTGETVEAGERIGDVGATGQVTGPHLHFELRKDNSLLDPQRYLAL